MGKSKHKFRRIFTRFRIGRGFGFRMRVHFALSHLSIFHAINCDCVECAD